jgi:PAS domain S-box-containing protein
MILGQTNPSVRTPLLSALLAGSLAVVVGGLVLMGWALDISSLESILPGRVSVKPNTAIALILAGIALLLPSIPAPAPGPETRPDGHRLAALGSGIGRICGLLAGLFGFLTLCEYVFHWNPGFDQWLFAEPAGTVGTSHPGRMAPESAACFIFLATASMTGLRKKPWASAVSIVSGLLVTVLALASLLTYMTPSLGPFGWAGQTIMAAPAAVAIAALGLAVLSINLKASYSSWALSRAATAVFGIGMGLSVIIGIDASRSVVQMNETNRWVTHTEQVLRTTSAIRAAVAQAQNHTRGYLLTGDEWILEARLGAVADGNREVESLERLVADSPLQQARMPRLKARVTEALQWFQSVIDANRAGLTESTRRRMVEKGQDFMDSFLETLQEIEGEERVLLQQRARESAKLAQSTYVIVVSGSLASVALFLGALGKLNRIEVERGRERLVSDHLAAIVEFSGDAIIGKDLNGIITSWNKGAENLFGYTAGEIVGASVTRLIPAERQREEDSILGRIQRGEKVDHFETVRQGKDGRLIDVSITTSPIRDGAGHVVGASKMARDITERKRAQEALRELNAGLEKRVRDRTAELEASNKELEAFSYSVSHDLRAPLRAIDGFSLALLEDYAGKLDETAQGFLRRIRVGSQRMAELIDDLLNLSRITRAEMRRNSVDLTAMAEEIVAELRLAHPERQVGLVVAPGLAASADAPMLRVVLNNLLGNAWKFTGRCAQARIEVGEREQDGQRVFFVRDNGAGFDMAYVGKLFGAFQRLHSVQEFEGTGIGLALVQRIIHRHGGRVWAEGAVEKGATFYFTIGNERTDS